MRTRLALRLGGALLALTLASSAAWAATVADAVRANDRAALQRLIAQKADVNAPDGDGTTALHWAARNGDLQIVKLLMSAGARATVANRFGVTPLQLAAENGNRAITEVLLKAGADANDKNREGETVLMMAARSGDVPTVKLLLASGAMVDARESWRDQTALMLAASENQAAIVQALVEAGAAVNGKDKVIPPAPRVRGGSDTAFQSAHSNFPKGGFTALMYAARDGAREAAVALADAKADLNAADPDGVTAMMLAVLNGHYELAASLLEKGANVNAVDRSGRGVLFHAVDMHTMEWLFSRPVAKPSGEMDAVGFVKLALEKGANPNARMTGRPFALHHDSFGNATLIEGSTPFMKAATTSDLVLMRMLLDHGADPNLTTKNNTTALMAAAGLNWKDIAAIATEPDSIEAITICLDHGGDVNAVNDLGETAAHGAAQRGADKVMRFLFDKGAKLDVQNKEGRTPFDEATGQLDETDDNARRPARLSTQALIKELLAKQAGR